MRRILCVFPRFRHSRRRPLAARRPSRPELRHGQIEELVHVALVSRLMIRFAREASAHDAGEPSFYGPGKAAAAEAATA